MAVSDHTNHKEIILPPYMFIISLNNIYLQSDNKQICKTTTTYLQRAPTCVSIHKHSKRYIICMAKKSMQYATITFAR